VGVISQSAALYTQIDRQVKSKTPPQKLVLVIRVLSTQKQISKLLELKNKNA
jgi:hypothetical protein